MASISPQKASTPSDEGVSSHGLARVPLPPGAAAQLVVDAPRLVALGADDAQPITVKNS